MTNSNKWYQLVGPEGDVVISTRIRLARNLPDLPFPNGLDESRRREVIERVQHALVAQDPQVGTLRYYDMQLLDSRTAGSMVERHLISPEFASGEEGRGLMLNEDESVSIMINEEDHLRIQVLQAGMVLDEAYNTANALDDTLDAELHFAFDERLGYLTQCPTNLGTGMRASLMLHLPALQERRAIQQLAQTVSKLGLTMRGLYGEGSKPEGAIYQLSNQVTLGISERAALANLKTVALQIVREERAAREQLCALPAFEDRIWRSLGVLKCARLLTHAEFMSLISQVRVGVACGKVEDLTLETISTLLHSVQPATLMMAADRDMEPSERDAARAELVRECLK